MQRRKHASHECRALLEDVMAGYRKIWKGAVVLLVAPLLAMAGPPPVKTSEVSIPSANHGGIRDWRADGSRGMWIEASSGRWFYASFSSQCTTLPIAIGLKFVPEPSGVLSRWSSIRLEHNERCFFRTLQPSDAPPKRVEPASPAASPSSSGKPTPGLAAQELLLSAPLQALVADDRPLI
jgi:hypothetical protein